MFSDFVSCVGAQCVWCVCVFTSVYTSCTFLWLFFFFFFQFALSCSGLFISTLFLFMCLSVFYWERKRQVDLGREAGRIWEELGEGKPWSEHSLKKKKNKNYFQWKKKDLFILIIYVWVFACLYVCVHRVNDWPLRRPEGSTGSPGAGIIAGCESPSRCWKPNPGPPQKQQVCVARDTSLQLLNSIWEGTWDERLL